MGDDGQGSASDPEQQEELATAAAKECDADILLVNAPIMPGLEGRIREVIGAREKRRARVIVVLVSAGGIADDAYRAAVAIRSYYESVGVCIAGWCKSAGTLLAIGADDLIIGCNGEMGPLDVQIAVKDELVDNRDSGLVLDAAIKGLTDNAFRVFEKFMTSLIEQSQGAITFRTAADLAANVTIGLMSPIYEKIDPLRMGADQRAQKIGRDYALRLHLKGQNLKGVDALNMLLNGYPSHGFVIDLDEASRLFSNVKALDGYLELAVDRLGKVARLPGDEPLVCFLDGDDDDDGKDSEGAEVPPTELDAVAAESGSEQPPAAAQDV